MDFFTVWCQFQRNEFSNSLMLVSSTSPGNCMLHCYNRTSHCSFVLHNDSYNVTLISERHLSDNKHYTPLFFLCDVNLLEITTSRGSCRKKTNNFFNLSCAHCEYDGLVWSVGHICNDRTRLSGCHDHDQVVTRKLGWDSRESTINIKCEIN